MQKLDVHVPSMMPTVLTVDIINCEQQVVTTECTAAAGEWKQFRRKYNLDRLEEYDFSGKAHNCLPSQLYIYIYIYNLFLSYISNL